MAATNNRINYEFWYQVQMTGTEHGKLDSRSDLRIGIVGCGKVAQYHARFIQEQKSVRLVGVADVNQEAARLFAAEHAIPAVKDSVASLLDAVPLDVLHVVTPPAYHYQCARAALDRGVHVFLEKPLAFTLAEVADLYERAAAARVLLCPDFIHLFHPRMRQLLQAVESGGLGQPVHVESRLCINLEEESSDLREAAGMHWSYLLPGGLLRDYASHALYLALYFAGWPNRIQVTRQSGGILPQDLPDHLTVQIDGTRCTATVLLSCGIRPSSLGVRVLCEKGSAELSLDTQTVLVRGKSSLPRRIQLATGNFADAWRLSTTAAANIANYVRGKVVPYGGLRRLLPEFYDSVRNSDLPPIRRELALAVTQAEETIFAESPRPMVQGVYCPSTQSEISRRDKVLLTGASGYIGAAVAQALVRAGYYVRALARPTSSLEVLKRLGVEICLGDIRRCEDVNAAAQGMDIIVHLAAGLRGSPQYVVDTSTRGTNNVSRAALLQGVRRVIYMSSMSVYDVAAMKNKQTLTEDSPLEQQAETRGAYSLGKRRAEDIALAHLQDKSPSWTVLRPSLVTGNSADPVAAVGWRLGRWLLCLGSPRKRLLLVHVEDVAAAILQLMEHENTSGKVYTLSHPDRITARAYIQACIRPRETGIRTLFVPYWFALLGMTAAKAAGKILHRGPSVNRRRLLSMYRNLNAGCDRLCQDTGWHPAPGLLRRLNSVPERPVIDERAVSEMVAGN